MLQLAQNSSEKEDDTSIPKYRGVYQIVTAKSVSQPFSSTRSKIKSYCRDCRNKPMCLKCFYDSHM